MPATNLTSRQIKNNDVIRDDINITTSGQALVTKVNPSTGLTLDTYTGVDPGTGDVTLKLSTSGVTAGTYGSDTLIPVIVVDTYGRITSVSTSTANTADTLATVTGRGATTSTAITVTNTITATAFYNSSDERLKDILSINSSFNQLDDLQMIEFRWKSQPNGPILYGYSAQQVLKRMPNLVSETNGHLVIDTNGINTIKINRLEQRVKELERLLQII